MWKDFDTFRFSYLFTVIIPILIAVISNNLTLVSAGNSIIGWSFIMIFANLLNDAVDMDRKLLFGRKSLILLAGLFVLFGLVILRNQLIFAVLAIIGWILYCTKIKGIVFVDIILMIGIVILPYLAISKVIDSNLVLFYIGFGIMTLLIDKLVDEPKYKKMFDASRILIVFLSVMLTIFLIYINVINFASYWYLSPLIPVLFGIGILFSFFKKYIKPTIKILAVYGANMIMLYLLAIILELGKFL